MQQNSWKSKSWILDKPVINGFNWNLTKNAICEGEYFLGSSVKLCKCVLRICDQKGSQKIIDFQPNSNWHKKENCSEATQINFQTPDSSNTLHKGWFKYITHRLVQIHCIRASSQRGIHLQTSPEKPRKHPPHKNIVFENLDWNCRLQAYPKISLPIFKHPSEVKVHATEKRRKPVMFNRKQLVCALRQCWEWPWSE